MASDIAAPQQHDLPQSETMDTSSPGASFDAPMTNGDHIDTSDNMTQEETAVQDAPAFSQPTAATETAIDTKVAAPFEADPNPAGPTPVDDVVSGIQPVSDFIPKDASNLSHPTPPPDEPLGTGEADVDMETPAADVTEQASAPSPPPAPADVSVPSLPQSESSLVRSREDDEEDQPAAKRTKTDSHPPEDLSAPAIPSADASMADQAIEETAEQAEALISETTAMPSGVDLSASETEPVVEETTPTQPTEESVVEPSSMDVEPATTQADTQDTTPKEAFPESESEVKAELPPEAASQVPAAVETQPDTEHSQGMDVTEPVGLVVAPQTEEKPAGAAATTEAQPASEATQEAAKPKYSTVPMTSIQKKSLTEKMKNLKKTKSSVAFLRPVDPVALNIPTYPQLIKNPMDLGTMETKLKQDEYRSVQDFVDDFELIINNSLQFNGREHAVTQAGFSMQAYFNRMMDTVPSADEVEPPKVQKKRSPSISREKPPRRESRALAAPPAPVPATAAPAAPTETYALQSDGMPQIRRQSSNRPARAIKPPQNREVVYAKPQRKAHKLELQFCEHVMDTVGGPKYGHINHVFQHPVDPVALNIPHYRQVIKQPMDLGSMRQKLRGGQYGTAVEFKKDFDLMIKNCLTFNPAGNPVRDLGIQLQRAFEQEWADKDRWERKNQPPSNRASSASADDDSDVEEEEDEDEDDDDGKNAKIRALQKQLAEMQNALSGLNTEKPKSKKSKSAKGSTKKAAGMSAASKSKAAPKPPSKPKKVKQVTYDEKQEISEAVGKMNEQQVGTLTTIITTNCAKYRDQEEMELEIDDLPNDVQVMLLDYVRKIFGNPNRKKAREPSPDDAAALDDDDFEPERGARAGKRKKHRPMGKKEQDDAIKNIQSKLAQFEKAATSGSESPTNSSFNANVKDETSGDEDSEESEEE